MKLADLVSAVAAAAGQTNSATEKVLKALGDVTGTALKSGDDVTLPGIGKLSVGERAARTGRNPRTGETLAIAAKKTVKFGAGKALKDAVAG